MRMCQIAPCGPAGTIFVFFFLFEDGVYQIGVSPELITIAV